MDSPEKSSRDSEDRADAESASGTMGAVGQYAGHGLTIGLSTALFTWLGSLLDARLGSDPLFIVSGAFLGFGAGFYSMYRSLVLEPAREQREEREESGEEPGSGSDERASGGAGESGDRRA